MECSVTVKQAHMSDNGVAIHYGIGGPDSLSFLYADRRFSLIDSTLVGISDPSKCVEHRDFYRPPKYDVGLICPLTLTQVLLNTY